MTEGVPEGETVPDDDRLGVIEGVTPFVMVVVCVAVIDVVGDGVDEIEALGVLDDDDVLDGDAVTELDGELDADGIKKFIV